MYVYKCEIIVLYESFLIKARKILLYERPLLHKMTPIHIKVYILDY